MNKTTVSVPASTANLGPGFDCLGLALNLWNQAEFTVLEDGLKISIQGEGAGEIPSNQDNLIYKAFKSTYQYLNQSPPKGLEVNCKNQIPLSSGLGSSASATLLGILGAKALLGTDLEDDEIIHLGTKLEGHPDNITPSLLGGLTISSQKDNEILTEKIQAYPWKLLIVLPEFELSTEDSRDVLPKLISVSDAVQNIGSSLLLVQALQSGDLLKLRKYMVDKIHQPYRLPLIPGAVDAIEIAQQSGAAAALSGAGPSMIAFTKTRDEEVQDKIVNTFKTAGLKSRVFNLEIDNTGARYKKRTGETRP
jgi:homoserine kinase